MGVGVEEAIREHLMEVRFEEHVGQVRRAELEEHDRAQIGDLRTRDVVHRQHARGRVVGHRLRHREAGEAREVLAEHRQVLGFDPVVELAQQALAELLDEQAHVVAGRGLRIPLDEVRDGFEHFEVVGHLRAHAGPLNLHGHHPPVAQDGAMHLRERGGGERRRVEFHERLGQPHPELGAHGRLDLGERHRRQVVLQARERLQVGIGEQVRAC